MRPTLWLPLAAALLATGPASRGQTLENGDFSRGMAIWKGDYKVVEDPDSKENKVLEIKLNKLKPAIFHQIIDSGNAAGFIVSFQVKCSPDFANDKPLTLRMVRPDTSYTWHEFLIGGTSWHTITWPFSRIEGAKKLDFTVECPPGAGKVWFDNFTVINPDKPKAAPTPHLSATPAPAPAGAASPVGVWLWDHQTALTTIRPDGTAVMNGKRARWAWIAAKAGTFRITWESGWIDDVTTPNKDTLHIRNNAGHEFDALRVGAATAPPDEMPFAGSSFDIAYLVVGYITGTTSREPLGLRVKIATGALRLQAPDKHKDEALVVRDIIPFLIRYKPGGAGATIVSNGDPIRLDANAHDSPKLPAGSSFIPVPTGTTLEGTWLAFRITLSPDTSQPITHESFVCTPVFLGTNIQTGYKYSH